MARKQNINRIIWLFAFVFSFMCFMGIYLTQKSISTQKTEFSGTVQPSKITFKLSTGAPGLVVLLIGAAGLLLLIIKVPVKEPIYKIPQKGDGGSRLSLMILHTQYEEYKLPLLLYWLLRGKLNLARK